MVSRSGNQKGGGYGSRQHVEKPIRTGSGSRGTNPGGVGQLGQMQGSHVTRGEESNYAATRCTAAPRFSQCRSEIRSR
jgi:hypothetical protein